MTKSYAEIQHEKAQKAFALIEVMQQTADDLGIPFDELSQVIDVPHNRPEFADYIPSLDCKMTYFEPRNNTAWYEAVEDGANKPKEIQSFQLFDIVLFRPSIDSEETVWIPLRIPVQSCHLFQTNAATHSISKLPLIPVNVATL
jgi:hypothetical protein